MGSDALRVCCCSELLLPGTLLQVHKWRQVYSRHEEVWRFQGLLREWGWEFLWYVPVCGYNSITLMVEPEHNCRQVVIFISIYIFFMHFIIPIRLQQPQEQRYPVLQVYAGSFHVSIIHWTLTWTTGFLTWRLNLRSLDLESDALPIEPPHPPNENLLHISYRTS